MKKPRHLEDYTVLALHVETYTEDLPESLEEVISREDKQEWMQAIKEEVDALTENNMWNLTKLPQGKRVLDNKWIFKIKKDKNGNIERYKARLVVKGYTGKRI